MDLDREQLLDRLQALAEPDYAAFSAALVPGCKPMLGVRLPALRRLARELARDLPAALAALGGDWFEEQMLTGLCIAYARLPDAERRELLETRFLPLLDNWSVCDATAATCKCMTASPDFWLPWLQGLAARDDEFPARFGLVCLLDHFTATPQDRRTVLRACQAAPCPAPYTRLAVAWAVSIAAVKEPDLGLAFLRADTLDAATHNKAIQKICESLRATPDYRAAVRALRR